MYTRDPARQEQQVFPKGGKNIFLKLAAAAAESAFWTSQKETKTGIYGAKIEFKFRFSFPREAVQPAVYVHLRDTPSWCSRRRIFGYFWG